MASQAISGLARPEKLYLYLETNFFLFRMAILAPSLSEDVSKTLVIAYL